MFKKNIGRSKLNMELSIKNESSSSSIINLTVDSDSSETKYTGTLMCGLLTNRKETINKIFNHLIHNSSTINVKHHNNKLIITSFNINDTITNNIEIELQSILKYYIPTHDFSYNISTNLLTNYEYNINENNIGFNITENNISIYQLNNNEYFENIDSWLEKHNKKIKNPNYKIQITLSSNYGNELYKNRFNEYINKNNNPILFQLSNQSLNQLYHFIALDKNELINLKYSKQKLYYNSYSFKNENKSKFEFFPNKYEIKINNSILKNIITIINNEDNSKKIILFYENSIGFWLLDNDIIFKCYIDL